MSVRFFMLSFVLFLLTGCAELYTGRSFMAEMGQEDTSFFNPKEDFPVVAGDTGRDWMSESERRNRTPASESDLAQDRTSQVLKSELRGLENMQSEDDMEYYQAHLKSLPTVSDRIYFLRLPHYERKAYLTSRGAIEEPKHSETPFERLSPRRNNDVLMGMRKNDVLASLGKPMRVEIAGNPRNENERWLYRMNGNQKYIYFESGRVEGWE
jgi:hypothetical protein